MIAPEPLETLYEVDRGTDLPLPPHLAAFYGRLQLPLHQGRPCIVGNFVTTLDGVVSLNVPGHLGGQDINGFNPHDRMVMGLLRAAADGVIVGAGTLRAVPGHIWTAEYIYPSLANMYQQFRTALGKLDPPLNVIVTAGGEIDLDLPVFRSGRVPVLIVTTTNGSRRIRKGSLPPSVQIAAAKGAGSISAHAILDAVGRARKGDVILVEGGPHLMGDFFAEQQLDEFFLTLAPQIAGRDGSLERPGLVAGKSFAPDHPLWGRLVGVKRSGNHLFLRYSFDPPRADFGQGHAGKETRKYSLD